MSEPELLRERTPFPTLRIRLVRTASGDLAVREAVRLDTLAPPRPVAPRTADHVGSWCEALDTNGKAKYTFLTNDMLGDEAEGVIPPARGVRSEGPPRRTRAQLPAEHRLTEFELLIPDDPDVVAIRLVTSGPDGPRRGGDTGTVKIEGRR